MAKKSATAQPLRNSLPNNLENLEAINLTVKCDGESGGLESPGK